LQGADTVDADLDDVPFALHGPDADGGSAADQVSGQQGHVLRDQAHQAGRREHHVTDRVILPLASVKHGAHHYVAPPDAGGYRWPERAMRSAAVMSLTQV
jgi:hypothetical protein